MATSYAQTWNLDSLYPGGSQSPQAHADFTNLENSLKNLEMDFSQPGALKRFIQQLEILETLWLELHGYVLALVAQNTDDRPAMQMHDRLDSLRAQLDIAFNQLNTQLAQLSGPDFQALITDPDLQSIAFHLQEKRHWTQSLLPLEQENLIQRLSVNGYRGWTEFYSTWIGQIRIPSKEKDETTLLSVGQAENKLSHPDRTVREAAFQNWQQTWQSHEDLFAYILNQLGGFRLNVYQSRNWDSVLKEPLFYNRMQEETLQCMWQTINQFKPILVQYLNKKAENLGLARLAWFDVEAPLPVTSLSHIPYAQAAEIIIREFDTFSPHMGQFARKAFEQRWIEAEDRPKKRPGGYCSEHPRSKQSRIFMTYSGTLNNLFTLAHELGHAYHNEVVKDLPIFSQQYAMNVAETASTLAEMVVSDSALKQAINPDEKRFLLDSKLQRAVIFLMNIHARFLFETRFYEARQQGTLIADQLNALMISAQQEAFANGLGEWYPQFWISKGHFYMTHIPFYNFPYTFGYLFSLGLYGYAKKGGKSFADNYQALLLDTGRMNVEDLAHKHLNAVLAQPQFWQEALNLIHHDVNEYLKL